MNANTPQGTGAMTLDQGVAHIKAKMAEHGASPDDLAIVHPEHPDEDDGAARGDELGGGAGYDEFALDEDDADVSADQLQDPKQESLDAKITLPDGSEITVEEARKGYLRQAEFTRKTQTLAQERERVAKREQAAIQELGGLHQHVALLEAMEPDWQALAQESTPVEMQRAQAYWQQYAGQVRQAKQALQQAQARTLADQRQQMWDTLTSGGFEPAWKDPKSLKKGLETLSEYLVDRGIPAELLSTVHLPAMIEIAEESRRYRELQKARPKAALAVRGKPMPFRPGAKTAASPQSETIRLLSEAFRKHPNVDNAVALQKAKAAVRRR
jgi:hypothetical protein